MSLPAIIEGRISLNDDLMSQICIKVADGGTLVQLCKEWNVSFGLISNWIHSDESRSKRYRQALNDRGEWATERLLQELRRLAFVDIRSAFTPQGTIKPMDQWPDELGSAVQSVDVEELFAGRGAEKEHIGQSKKIKFWDKNKSIETLCKTMQMFQDRVEITASESIVELVKQSLSNNG